MPRGSERPGFRFSVTDAGRYVIGVGLAGGSPGDAATYGLAWSAAPGAGLDHPGDANLDGEVDVLDLTAVANHFAAGDATWFEGDFNSDGAVDVLDLAAVANHFGWTAGAAAGAAAVPEPASAALLLLGGAALAWRKRR